MLDMIQSDYYEPPIKELFTTQLEQNREKPSLKQELIKEV